MIDRVVQGRGRVGSGGHGGRAFRLRGRGSGHYTATININKGLFSALGNNVFDYGQKGAADQMRTTWENNFPPCWDHVQPQHQQKTAEPKKGLHPQA